MARSAPGRGPFGEAVARSHDLPNATRRSVSGRRTRIVHGLTMGSCQKLPTRFPFSKVRTQGGRLWVDGLVVDDPSRWSPGARAERMARNVRCWCGPRSRSSPACSTASTGSNADFVKGQFEKTGAASSTRSFVERARSWPTPDRAHPTRLSTRKTANGPGASQAHYFGDIRRSRWQTRQCLPRARSRADARGPAQRSPLPTPQPLATPSMLMAIGAMRDNVPGPGPAAQAMDEKARHAARGLLARCPKAQLKQTRSRRRAEGTARDAATRRMGVAAAIDALASRGTTARRGRRHHGGYGQGPRRVVTSARSHGPAGRIVFRGE